MPLLLLTACTSPLQKFISENQNKIIRFSDPQITAKEKSWITEQQLNITALLKDPESVQFKDMFIAYRGKAPIVFGLVKSKNSFSHYSEYKRFAAAGKELIVIEGENIDASEMDNLWHTVITNAVPANRKLAQQQLEFHEELKTYTLPQKTIYPKDCKSKLVHNVMNAASTIGEKQGLIVDGRQAESGKLILGKCVQDRSILMGIQFNFKPNGAFSYSSITSSSMLDFETCKKMESDYLSALKELFN